MTDEYSLPVQALGAIPQQQAAEIFAAQRTLLAELQRLRNANERLHIALYWQYRRWGVPERAAWSNAVTAGDDRDL